MRPSRKRADRLLRAAAAATASGVRRYPREILDSLRVARLSPRGLLELDAGHASLAPLAATWLGHATVLIRVGGLWVLTDPVMSQRIGPRVGPLTVGPARLVPPFDLATLPPVDLVLLSHAHFDHLDRPTLRRLASPYTRVVTARHTARLIPPGFASVDELDWDRSLDLGPLAVTAIRPSHWGARTAWDRHRGFNSYLLTTRRPESRRVLFAGDTAATDAFRAVKDADLTIFGIGAYDPWIHAHATPEQVWDMHTSAGARHLLPMHHSTFRLSDEPPGEPLARLRAAAGSLHDRIVATRLGEVWSDPGP